MLPTNLNTGEVRNAAGAEVEFSRYSQKDRELTFQAIGELPHLPHRIGIKHAETGSGINRRRRSVIRVDKGSLSAVDTVTPVVTSTYIVVDAPVGHLTTDAEITSVLAELNSFVATLGAAILLDGTGNGSVVLRSGAF